MASRRQLIAGHGRSEFLGEIGMLTGQRAYLSAVATSAGQVLAVPVAQLRRIMAQEPGLSDLILRTFLLRHSILMSRGTGLTLIGSRFDPDTRRLLEVLARNRLVSTWLDLEASPEAKAIVRGLDLPVADLPVVIIPGGPLLRNPGGRALLTRWAWRAGKAPIPLRCATCWWWAGARPAWPLRSTAHPRGWRRSWPRKPRWEARREPRLVSRTTWVFRRACPARNWRRGRRCRRRSSAPASSRRPGHAPVVGGRLAPGHFRRRRGRAGQVGHHRHRAHYNRLPLDRLAEFEGVGVYYAATQAEAQACGTGPGRHRRRRQLRRSGRSFPQPQQRRGAHHHPGGFADASMSRYLIDRIERNPRIIVWPRTQVTALTGTGQLQGARSAAPASRGESELAIRGLFVFIGAKPGTGWLSASSPKIAADSCSPAPTSRSRARRRNLTPLFLETSRPGIFAVGDVRSGSVKRAAAAIGEGSMAVRLVFDRLQSTGSADAIELGTSSPSA